MPLPEDEVVKLDELDPSTLLIGTDLLLITRPGQSKKATLQQLLDYMAEELPPLGIGTPGESSFVYIAYADADDGFGFTMTFDQSKAFIAIKSTTAAIAEPQASDFAGLWKNYNGIPSVIDGGTYEGLGDTDIDGGTF